MNLHAIYSQRHFKIISFRKHEYQLENYILVYFTRTTVIVGVIGVIGREHSSDNLRSSLRKVDLQIHSKVRLVQQKLDL